MDLGLLTRDNTNSHVTKQHDVAPAEAGLSGLVDVDPMELDSAEVAKLILQVDSVRRKLDGLLTVLLGRFGDLEGEDAVVDLCRQFGVGRHKARRQAKTASILKDLPYTLEASKDGWITIDHAQVVGESHQRAPMDEEQELELIGLAITEDLDRFKKTVARLEEQRASADGLSRHEQQRRRRRASVFDGDNDMIVLHAELDRVAGERVKTALDDLGDRMFRDDTKSGNDRTHNQRTADALVTLITQKPGKPGSSDDELEPAAQATTLIVTAHYDAITNRLQNAGLIDGTPIDTNTLRRIACDAAALPIIFDTDGQPLYLGTKQRSATQAQKLALYARDRHCTGCGHRATACDAHHIQWWEHGGPTDITNLALLCPTCHNKTHQHNHTTTQHPNSTYQLEPPRRDRRASPTGERASPVGPSPEP